MEAVVARGVTNVEPLPASLRIAVFAPYPALRAGLRSVLAELDGLDVVAEFGTATFETTSVAALDVIVGDPGDDGPSPLLVETLRERPAVLLVGDPAPYLVLLRAGVTGLGLLSRESLPTEIAAAAKVVAAGNLVLGPGFVRELLVPSDSARPNDPQPLTDRESDVLRLMAQGLPNKIIATRLGISEHTAKFHVGAILGKLNAASRTEAVMTAARNGWLAL